MENVKEIVDLLDSKMSNYKNDLAKEVEAANKKAEEITAEVNEKMSKQGASLKEIQDTLKEVQAKQGRIGSQMEKEVKTFSSEFGKALEEKAADIAKVGRGNALNFKLDGISMDTKAVGNMLLSANLTGNSVATYDLNPAVRGRRKVHFRDIPGVSTVNSATGTLKFYRQNNPVGEGSFGVQTEGSAKAQIDYDVTEQTVTIDVIAGFARISKQMLRDLPFMQSFLPNELQEDYYRAEDNKFINTLMPYCSAGTSGGVYAEDLITSLSTIWAADYDPTAIVTTAAKWATLLNTKPNDYAIPGGVTIDASGNVMFAGVPVVISNAMTSGHTFIGDFSKIKIAQASGLNVNFYEQDSDNVQKNLITVRAEAEVALAILRTDAVLYV